MAARPARPGRSRLLAGWLAGCLLAFPALARAADTKPADAKPATAKPATTGAAKPATAAPQTARAMLKRNPSSHRQAKLGHRAQLYYESAWGVDRLKVSYTASGNLIRFSYRVSDPERAQVLADKSATPYLFGQKSRAMLQVPVMDKVGQLRQATKPQAGKEYWMVFSNKGNLIKPGDLVNVMIGAFHADGLTVEGS